MKEFTTVAEMQAHYREVKSRRPPYVVAKAPLPEPETVSSLPPEPWPSFRPGVPAAFPTKRLARIVCDHYGVEWQTLTGPVRERGLVRPRQVFCYICHEVLGISWPKIARILNRDHTTALHGCRKIAQLLIVDPDLVQDVEAITARYKEGRPS